MSTRQTLKAEIDKVQDRDLELLYRVVKAFTTSPEAAPAKFDPKTWPQFINNSYGSLADDLNRRLPEGYFAEEHGHAGTGVEVDVPTRESRSRQGATAPPTPARGIPAVLPIDFEATYMDARKRRRL